MKEKYLDGFVPYPEEHIQRYKQKGYWEDLNFGQIITKWVQLNSNRPALVFQGETPLVGDDSHRPGTRQLYFRQDMGGTAQHTPQKNDRR